MKKGDKDISARGKGKINGKRRGSEIWLPPASPTWSQHLISNFADTATKTPIGISAPFFPATSNPIPSSPVHEVLSHLFEGTQPFAPNSVSLWVFCTELPLNVAVREVTPSFPRARNGFASASFPT